MPFIGDQATANAKIKKHVFTAEGSQTAFTVASNASDELQVFLNGVLLKLTDDYTYTTSTVTLGSGATVSDIVEVHVYQSFALVDAVGLAGGTMTGELEVPTVKLSSNVIKASDGGSTLTLDTSDNLTVAGNVQVGGNIIKASDGGSSITLDTSDNVTIAGDLKVGAVKASDGTAGISIADSTGRITVTETNPVVTLGSNATFPAGHIIYTNSDNRTSTGASADPGGGGMVDTGLTVTVPSATITACSKIFIAASGSCVITNDTYSICQYHLRRVESATTTSIAFQNVGFLTTVSNNYHGNWGFSWVDTSLGSGDHIYKITVSAGGDNHSAAITYLGYSGTQCNITVIGIV